MVNFIKKLTDALTFTIFGLVLLGLPSVFAMLNIAAPAIITTLSGLGWIVVAIGGLRLLYARLK